MLSTSPLGTLIMEKHRQCVILLFDKKFFILLVQKFALLILSGLSYKPCDISILTSELTFNVFKNYFFLFVFRPPPGGMATEGYGRREAGPFQNVLVESFETDDEDTLYKN